MERQGNSTRGKDSDTPPGAPDEDIPNEASEATRNLLRTIDCPDGSACTAFRCLFSHETRAEHQEPDLFNSRYNSAQSQVTRKPSNNVVRSVSPSSSLSLDVSEAPSRAQGPTGTPEEISTSLSSTQDRNNRPVSLDAKDLSTVGKEHVNIDNKFLQKVLNTGSAVSPRASPKTSGIVLPPISRPLGKQAAGPEPKIKLDPNVSNDCDNNLGTPIVPSPLPPPRWLGPPNMPRYPSILSMPHSLPGPSIYDPERPPEVYEHWPSGEPHPQYGHHSVVDQASQNQTEGSSRPADPQAADGRELAAYKNGELSDSMDLDQYVPRFVPIGPKADTNNQRSDEIRLIGGISENGRPAEFVRIKKDGTAISMATGKPVVLHDGPVQVKRSLSEVREDEEEIMRSMARRKKNASPEELASKRCREPGCNKQFKRPCDLTKHEKTHSRHFPLLLPDPRKYQCTQCDKSFRLAKDLDRHYKSIHATDTDLYRCRCNYSSYRKDQMKVHIKSRKCLPASSNDVHTCVCKTFETPSVDEYLDHIENCGKKRVGRPKKRGSPEPDEGHGNHKSNIAFEDGFGLHHDRYQFQSPAGDIDTLKKNFDYNMIQKDGTPLSRVAQQPAELLPLVFTSPASVPFFPRPLSPRSNISGSLKAKDKGELQDNGRSSRCIFCKQKQDPDTDTDSARFLSCIKCGEHAHYQCAANAPYASDTGNPGDRDIIISSNFDMESDVGFLNMFPEPEISPTNWTCPNCVEDASDSSENEKRSLENSASPEPSTNKEEHTIDTIMSKELKEGSDPGKATVSDMAPPQDNPFIQPTVNNQLNKNAGHKDAHQLQKPASSTVNAFWRDSIKKGDSSFNGFMTNLAFDRAAFDSVGAGQARHEDLARAVESATDSGYGSQPPIGSQKSLIEYHAVDAQYETDAGFDDTATEYSDTSSVATWKKESYIEEFVDDLLARVRELQPDEETLDRISALLPDLLKAFALRVGYNAPSRMHRDVMYFIHKHRGMISSNFKEKSLHRGEDTPDGTMLPGESDRIPLQDLMKSWFSSLSNVEIRPENELWDPILRSDDSDLESQASALTDASQDVTEGDNDAWLRSYRDFIRNSEVFQWLLGRLYVESSLVATEPRAMEAIRAKIISSLRPSQRISRNASSECFNASFCVGWDPFRFFQSQEYDLKAAEVASRIITLTGSENDAQALTCSQYLSQTWPTTGSLTLKLIKGVLQNRPNHMQNCTYPDGTTVIARLHDSIFTAHVTGVADSIAEIGEQIAWILASLRTSDLSNGLLSCTPVIARVNENGPRFQDLQSKSRPTVTFDIEILSEEVPRPVKPEDGQCWHNMFLNPVVVKGYPIRRKAEKNSGVEMTLDIMAGLARANVVDEFNGMTFIKGFSTMLVPTQKVKETILWHLVYNEDGTRISFNDHNMPHIERVSALELSNFRHVVGWCSEARFFPGSSQCNYTIGASGLPKPHQGCALANLFVSPGRCIVSNALYSLGQKDTPVHVARNGYIPKLQWLSTKLVLLWDEQDKRGWLINGTSALLYLVRSSLEHNSRDKFRSAFIFKKENLKESPNPYTADSANDVLINEENCALKLYKENNHFLLLQGRIEHYFNILEKLIDHQSDISQDGEVNMENRTRGDLEGWDFKDLATNRDPLYPRIAHLEASGKAWVDFARAAQVITLFGKGFGELIKPAGSDICAYWSELPKQNYYIAACLSDLDLWVENNDHYNDDQVRLTEKIIWHTPSPCLFGSCRCVGSLGPDHCEPVQTLVPVSLSHILLPRKVQIPSQGRGAVIFGQHSAFPWVWGDYGYPEYGKLSSHHSSKGSEAGSSFADSGISLERSKSTLSRESSTPDLKRRLAELEYENGSVMANSFTSMSGSHEHSLRDPMNYTVGILCALPKESLAVRALFDKCNGKPDLSFGDSNHYSLGQIGKHMVVVACLPEGEYGTNPAAESASNMKRSFPAIQFCLLIGIGGGAPSEQNDIRLGDVVVSKPTKTFPGVIQYDRGKANENNDFQLTGALQRPPRFLMTAVSSLSSDPNLPSDPLEPYLQEIIHRVPGSKKLRYQHPGQEYDELFDEVCSKCQIQEHYINRERHIRRRTPRPNKSPEIHYGLIASGNLVIKDAQVRDQWVKKFGVMCFEMEAAGVMNTFPCLVIRGICDYSDSYKNERWQEYAAATAAAYGKLLLNEVSPFSLSYSPSSELKHRTLEYLGFEENMSKRRRL